MSEEQEKNPNKKDVVEKKKKRHQLYGMIAATERMLLATKRYFVNSGLQLLPIHETANSVDRSKSVPKRSVLQVQSQIGMSSKSILYAFASVTPYKKISKRQREKLMQ